MAPSPIRSVLDRIQLTVGKILWGRTSSTIRGVSGWLLFLCILLTIVIPLGLLAEIGTSGTISEALAKRFPVYTDWMLGCEFAELALFFYSIFVGINLWKIRKGAVTKAQTFLLVYLGFLALRALTPYYGDLSHDMQSKLVILYGRAFLRSLVFTAVWHQYLARSIRVKNTFLN